MDAIKNVEAEVDKVLRLFSSYRGVCENEIDKAIEFVETSKRELNALANGEYHTQLIYFISPDFIMT